MTTPHNSPLHGAYATLSPADAIAVWMAYYELSESDVATATGLPLNTITRLARGSQAVTGEIADALAVATGVPASRWLSLQHHHAVWTAGLDRSLAAHDGVAPPIQALHSRPVGPFGKSTRVRGVTTKGFGYVRFTTENQEVPMGQPRVDPARQLPLYNSTTLHALADLWSSDRAGLTEGRHSTAVVLAQLADLMRAAGVTYLSAPDLDTLASAVRSPNGEPDTASPAEADRPSVPPTGD